MAPLTPPPSAPRILHDSGRICKKASPDSKSLKSLKSWSTEDERILLQSRMQRVPYKQIATKLGKTDLACRLHFHQMSMAKRNPSTQPGRSIVFLSSEHLPEVHHLAPRGNNGSATCSSSHDSKVRGILQPNSSTMTLITDSDQALHHRSSSFPEYSTTSNRLWQPASLSCTDQGRRAGSNVDMRRLRTIYRECASDFWSNIAEKYSGAQLSASDLEQAFFDAQNLRASEEPPCHSSLLLPAIELTYPSPVYEQGPFSETRPSFERRHSTVSANGKCSVESLLNHPTY